jgi:hypothetical protein
MRKRANVFPMVGAVVALQALFPIASLATDGGDPEEPAQRAGEDRWVPSLAITGGATIQEQQGSADSFLFEDMSPIRGFVDGDDLAASPFVGGSLELMAPALPIPTRPRLFVSGEILPTFASDREVALEGDPDCVRGPEPDAPCASDPGGLSGVGFGEDGANGQGTSTTAKVGSLAFGASLGVAFPFQVRKRQLRIKPSVGWINYEVEAEGFVVDAACNPASRCNDVTTPNPSPPPANLLNHGYLRETILTASDSQRFNGIGPGLDIEMDAGRFGPLGVSLFLGGGAYYIVGDRTLSFRAEKELFDQPRHNDVDDNDPSTDIVFPPGKGVGEFEVEVDPWMYRAHVGIRIQWLGGRK